MRTLRIASPVLLLLALTACSSNGTHQAPQFPSWMIGTIVGLIVVCAIAVALMVFTAPRGRHEAQRDDADMPSKGF